MIYFHFFSPLVPNPYEEKLGCGSATLLERKVKPEENCTGNEAKRSGISISSPVVCQKVPVRWYDWYDLLGSPVLVPDGLLGRRLCLTEENMQRHQTLLQVFNLNRFSSFNPLGSVVDPNSIWIQGVKKKK